MEEVKLFDLNIAFYSNVFNLNCQDKENFINPKKIISIISDSQSLDLYNPLIQECIFKSSIFAHHISSSLSQVHESFSVLIKHVRKNSYSLSSKCCSSFLGNIFERIPVWR